MEKTVFGMATDMTNNRLDDATLDELAKLFNNCNDLKEVRDSYIMLATGDHGNGWLARNIKHLKARIENKIIEAVMFCRNKEKQQ